MSAGCARWILSRTARAVCGGSQGYLTPGSRFPIPCERSNIIASSWRWSPFSTAVEDTEQTPAPKKKNKHDPKAHATINAVGRKIPHREIQVISETGENLGTMHRADVIRILDQQGLKLVLLSERKDPPTYRLMSGKQIHEEQLKLREKQKAKAAPLQVKELTFSSGIGAHDLSTKMKQVESWLEKKNHVRLTLRSGRGRPADNLDTTLEQIVQQMEVMVGFVSKPKTIRDGHAAMCILRPPSAKELSQNKKNKDEASQDDDSTSRSTESETPIPPAAGDTDATEGSIQQGSDGNKTFS
ncbi:translation initiation factor IF-3, mitochondrial [Anoplopoma fimbria]|uniref:translation initiation factor IF-3, mitochondrial n=1 Tax=Anoplopoma fimbria TaxID=229290 RepID=UPI0023EDDA05|nr:translation initiation factor IF-3, mitochondrial [Anoplopoma fimbria]XP_054474779.1 translation initiation factor IF-3, mitochondrial [Anoplopoma fimbria]XP_054474780.1 translation initiation factor IF-3, mitochondrial [Anoplopoma fimbria]